MKIVVHDYAGHPFQAELVVSSHGTDTKSHTYISRMTLARKDGLDSSGRSQSFIIHWGELGPPL